MHAGKIVLVCIPRVWLISISILYKTKLPFIIVFNKTDVQPHAFALEWMRDFEAFQEALATHQSTSDDDGAPTYMNSLMNSMSLVLDEFYKHLKVGSHPFASTLLSHLCSQ
jgi:GPN-loop GTPase